MKTLNLLNVSGKFRTTTPKSGGFSLMELMVALVIIGILVAIALPAYNSSVQASRRTDAKNALLDLASREEKFFTQNNAYTQSVSSLYPGNTSTGNTLNVEGSGTVYYVLTISSPATGSTSNQTFSATADPQTGASQATDVCGSYTINNFGVTGNTVSSGGTPPTTCW